MTAVHVRWSTQPKVAKRHHLAEVHGTFTTEGVSEGWLDEEHKIEHRSPLTYLHDREHKHTSNDI